MARLLLAWELGGGLGHAQALTALADALLRRGHAVDLAWKDLSVAGAVLGERLRHPRLRLWPAPVWTATLANMPEPANHAELLFRAGPALLVADHAPTALLAARGQPLRRLLFGNGFCIPPAEGPWPAFREWETPAPAPRLPGRRHPRGRAAPGHALAAGVGRADRPGRGPAAGAGLRRHGGRRHDARGAVRRRAGGAAADAGRAAAAAPRTR
ncbi:hypothetical protein ABXN37_07975 [Piscinibacter sakaiensis]|uniref:hypothetical protein n=1 Tax=Piscinibacter sakaiensis TaxID=1547922 RepID=UPI00372C182E